MVKERISYFNPKALAVGDVLEYSGAHDAGQHWEIIEIRTREGWKRTKVVKNRTDEVYISLRAGLTSAKTSNYRRSLSAGYLSDSARWVLIR